MTRLNRRLVCRLVAPALVLALVTGGQYSLDASAAARSSSLSLSSLVLSTKDVKAAYGASLKPALSKVMPNNLAILTFGTVGEPSSATVAGRVTGYETAYMGRGQGVFNVVSIVNAYKKTSDAQRALANASRAKPAKGLTGSIASISGVGSAAVIEKLDSVATSSVTIGFQRGRYTAAVAVGALGTKVAVPTVLTLAKLIDGRIKAHG